MAFEGCKHALLLDISSKNEENSPLCGGAFCVVTQGCRPCQPGVDKAGARQRRPIMSAGDRHVGGGEASLFDARPVELFHTGGRTGAALCRVVHVLQ